MAFKTTESQWGSIARFLHWSIALLVIAMLIGGNLMGDLPNGVDKLKTYALHKSLGLTILALMLLRLIWRFFDPRPADPPGIGTPARMASRLVHASFYLLLIAMPLSGWLYNSASNFPLKWFGLFSVPALSSADKGLKTIANQAHETISWLILAVLLVHVVAALKHHWVDRDDVLRRMLPWRKKPSEDKPI